MTDFCYMANMVVMVFLNLHPKSEALFITSFLFSMGSLMVAVGAFRNQMVFHNVDNMSSLALHMFPALSMFNLHWNTMEYEKTLPISERKFLQYDKSKPLDLTQIFGIPVAVYLIWIGLYFIINFVISAKRIRERNYDTMYIYYEKKPWAKKLLDRKGIFRGPVLFLSFHFAFFFVCHCMAVLCFKFYWFNLISVMFWLTWSIWNSSCFYMDYFSKKYEASLQRMD